MSPKQVREKLAKIHARIEKIKAKYEPLLAAEYAQAEAIRKLCKHPNIRHYNIGFDSGSQCPDCGLST